MVAAGQRLSVDALQKNMLDLAMTFPAGRGDIELVDRRAGIVCRKNLVRPMAIRAVRGALRTSLHRPAMHAVLIRREDLGTDATSIHHKLLAVAMAAGRRNIGVIDG